MRLYRSVSDIRGRRVLVMGLGTKDGGVGAALFASANGGEVTVTDLQPASALGKPLGELKDLDITRRLGGHAEEDFRCADIVLRNPSIRRKNRYLAIASEAGAVVDSPVGVFCEETGGTWIGITGTKGKSYTTHLTSHLLSSAGIRSVAAGNNCVSPLRTVDDRSLTHVLELSSWQLSETGLHGKSPDIGCWLNFFPDHMNWYGSVDEYRSDKEMIWRYQSPDDVRVVPADDPEISAIPARSRSILFSASSSVDGEGCFVRDGMIAYRTGSNVVQVTRIDLLPDEMKVGLHLDLVPPSVCCAVAAGADPGRLGEALRSFTGLPYRFQTILSTDRLRVVNDSAATTPESVIRALQSLEGSFTVLIAGGGGHKNLDHSRLLHEIEARVGSLVLFGDDSTSGMLSSGLQDSMRERVHMVRDIDEAVETGLRLVQDHRNATLILSPGCSGAPFFVDLFERGLLFDDAVRKQTGGNNHG